MQESLPLLTAAEADKHLAEAHDLRYLGNGMFKEKKIDDAAQAYGHALPWLEFHAPSERFEARRAEECATCHLNLAACRLGQKAWQEAADACTLSIEVRDGVKARYRRAAALLELSCLDDCQADIDAGLLLMNTNDDASAGAGELRSTSATSTTAKSTMGGAERELRKVQAKLDKQRFNKKKEEMQVFKKMFNN
jgi:hypothetical protein